ncbi:porin [Halomonas organivorans]
MKKTLLATAIAGAMAASGAQAATVYNQDGTKLDIYGNIQLAYSSLKNDAGDSEDQIADNGSTFGFAAQHAITSDLTGYLKLEFDDFDASEIKTAGRQQGGDEAYVGIRGNFGDVRLGNDDTLFNDWVQDPLALYEFFGVTTSGTSGGEQEHDKLTYFSPSLGGFQFAVETQYKGDAEDEIQTGGGDSEASFGAVAKYTVGGLAFTAGYDDRAAVEETGTTAEGEQYGGNIQYTIDTLRLTAKYEVNAFDDDAVGDTDLAGISARYGYGMGDVYGVWQNVDPDNGDERDEVVIGGTYSVSDAMYVWAEAGWFDEENDSGDGFATGVAYLF